MMKPDKRAAQKLRVSATVRGAGLTAASASPRTGGTASCDVKIRNLDNALVAFYKQRAVNRGVSLEEVLRETLVQEQRRVRLDWAARLDLLHARQLATHGVVDDSTAGIRAERDGEPDA